MRIDTHLWATAHVPFFINFTTLGMTKTTDAQAEHQFDNANCKEPPGDVFPFLSHLITCSNIEHLLKERFVSRLCERVTAYHM